MDIGLIRYTLDNSSITDCKSNNQTFLFIEGCVIERIGRVFFEILAYLAKTVTQFMSYFKRIIYQAFAYNYSHPDELCRIKVQEKVLNRSWDQLVKTHGLENIIKYSLVSALRFRDLVITKIDTLNFEEAYELLHRILNTIDDNQPNSCEIMEFLSYTRLADFRKEWTEQLCTNPAFELLENFNVRELSLLVNLNNNEKNVWEFVTSIFKEQKAIRHKALEDSASHYLKYCTNPQRDILGNFKSIDSQHLKFLESNCFIPLSEIEIKIQKVQFQLQDLEQIYKRCLEQYPPDPLVPPMPERLNVHRELKQKIELKKLELDTLNQQYTSLRRNLVDRTKNQISQHEQLQSNHISNFRESIDYLVLDIDRHNSAIHREFLQSLLQLEKMYKSTFFREDPFYSNITAKEDTLRGVIFFS